MRVLWPKTWREALEMLANEGAGVTPIAGGTDLLASWHHRPHDDLCMLDLSGLREEAGGIEITDEHIELGALATFWDVMCDRRLDEAAPLLGEAAAQVGAVQIQTRGTWAGNIANGSPGADGVTVLMAYGAEVALESIEGETTTPLNDYFTGYKQSVRREDQLIRAIRVPRRKRGLEWFHKVGARQAQAIAKVGTAMVREDGGATWRVAANSVAPFVCRCRALEQELEGGRTFDSPEEVRRVLEADVAPIDDIRSTAEYRATVLSRLIYFKLRELGDAAAV